MKRSEINNLIRSGKKFFDDHQFRLPPWAYWKPEDWKGKYDECSEIVDNMLGWDLTDFGSRDFLRRGLILFTLRNGNPSKDGKTYAEKIMIVEENQETPMHYHWNKMEDIINRGGGNLVMELYKATDNNELSDEPVTLKVDGRERTVEAGGIIKLTPGESVCLEPKVFHRFYGEEGKGRVLTGEVSAVNDDTGDNYFYDEVGRFPDIEEDEAPLHLLASEYSKYL
jgi:hypothetical protein